MEKKLVFLDIDGTLVAPGEMDAPQSAVEAIHTAQANGHKVFLCTGRNLRMTSPMLKYNFDGYVCSAGGYVVCDDKVLVDCPMEDTQRDGLLEALGSHGVDCTLEAKDMSYSDGHMLKSFTKLGQTAALNSEAERWRKVFEGGVMVRPLADYHGEPIYKICYMAKQREDLEPARALYEDQFVFCEQKMPGSSGDFVNGELINRKFDKGTGIKAICTYLGLSMADTIGFGDSENDLQMTDVVGISVCMANGSDALKARCDRICPAVTEDGLAREFKALGLI